MSVRFYTDPHLGVTRAANTTQASSRALQDALFEQAKRAAGDGSSITVCLGDMFDNYSNPEPIHNQGMELMRRTHMTLCGNHDVVNRSDRVGTLEVLNSHWSQISNTSRCLFSSFGRPAAHSWKLDGEKSVLVFVPHVATQALFEESLDIASKTAKAAPNGYTVVLCLHCNYDFPDERLTETTLNLSRDRAEQALKDFDYIVMGHEHIPVEHFGGRLIILGNTHPSSFSDVSNKRIAFLENGKFRFETIWSKDTGYAEIQAGDLPESVSANFVRVKGSIEPGSTLDVMRAVSSMWRRSPNLYVLKMELDTASSPNHTDNKAVSLSHLPEMIRKELKDTPDLLSLWDRLRS